MDIVGRSKVDLQNLGWYAAKLAERDAEIEHLHHEVVAAKRASTEAAEEIRKLREQLSRFGTDAGKEIAKANARESVLYEKCEDWRMEAKRLQAENERLQNRIARIETTNADSR